MEESVRIEAINGEFHLPGVIIQHIQSFLDGKQAARTSVLSKSWYNAWLTRPNLDFDQRNFQPRGGADSDCSVSGRFSNFAINTLRRYQEPNLKIESFKLWMNDTYVDLWSLPNKLILEVLKMGVSAIEIEFKYQIFTFFLPFKVLETETLVRLSAIGCRIYRPLGRKVNCSKLESLSLQRVRIEDDLFWDIISSCPVIEKLLLSECLCDREDAKSLLIWFGKRNLISTLDGPIEVSKFQKLKYLSLKAVSIDTLFFCDFSLVLPCLEDLTLLHCFGYEDMQISSRSLKCISVEQCVSHSDKRMLGVFLNVPNILNFKFSGTSFPWLSVTTDSGEWASDISVKCLYKHLGVLWFRQLTSFMRELSRSKIALNVEFCGHRCSKSAENVRSVNRPLVEKLLLSVPCPFYGISSLWDGLFLSCRPKVITLCWFPGSCKEEKTNNRLLKLLCEKLMQVNMSRRSGNQNMLGIHDLVKVNMEIFAEKLGEWLPLSLATLLNAPRGPENKQKVRVQLEWSLSEHFGAR